MISPSYPVLLSLCFLTIFRRSGCYFLWTSWRICSAVAELLQGSMWAPHLSLIHPLIKKGFLRWTIAGDMVPFFWNVWRNNLTWLTLASMIFDGCGSAKEIPCSLVIVTRVISKLATSIQNGLSVFTWPVHFLIGKSVCRVIAGLVFQGLVLVILLTPQPTFVRQCWKYDAWLFDYDGACVEASEIAAFPMIFV